MKERVKCAELRLIPLKPLLAPGIIYLKYSDIKKIFEIYIFEIQ
jgi:hypothetical protein